MGVIVTKPRTKQEKKLQTQAEADLRAGLQIFAGISEVMRVWRPLVAAMEAGAGSKSVTGAKGNARSQQACGDAVFRHLGGIPICMTVQAVKKATIGKNSSDKGEIQAAVERLWAGDDLVALLKTPPPYLDQGQRLPPPGKWENGYDALSVAHAVKDHPVVAAARQLAAAA